MAEAPNTLDHPWKEALGVALPDFFHLLFPKIGLQLDFSEPPRFLDAELRRLRAESMTGPLHADRLVEV